MGIRGEKETKKSLRDVQAIEEMGSDFEMIEGEGILWVRNKNQTK